MARPIIGPGVAILLLQPLVAFIVFDPGLVDADGSSAGLCRIGSDPELGANSPAFLC
jgi:hypothetical protein